jgi:[ribosomal protein S5]-alanine N-acetyltransferase
MTPAKKSKNETAEAMGKMVRAFGETVGEILDDPKVKQNAKEFAESVVDAAAKVIQSKVEDKEVRAKFRKVGSAAETLGKNLEEHFKTA